MAITDDERRDVARWAAGSAERVLPLFEAIAPGDRRPREACEAARAFAAGGRRTRSLFAVALAAHRAGRDIGDPVGLAVARSASLAAATANIHGEETIGTLGHILGAAAYAALARELAAGGDPAAGEAEVGWAIRNVTPGILALIARIPHAAAGRHRVDAIQARLEAHLRSGGRSDPGWLTRRPGWTKVD
jgi:hypothetical protein